MTLEEVLKLMVKYGAVKATVGEIQVELHPAVLSASLLKNVPTKAKLVTPEEEARKEYEETLFAHVGGAPGGNGSL